VHTPGWRKPVVRPSLCALRRPPLLSVARVLRGALPWYAHRRPSRGTPSTPTAAGPLLSVRTGHPRGSVRSPERVLRQQDSAGGVVGGRVACGAQDVQQVAQVRAGPFRRRRAAVSRVTSRCRSAPSARRSVETSTCTVLAALAPARSPRTPSMIWCTGTTRSAPSSRTAGKARCFGPPSGSGCPSRTASTAPGSRNSITCRSSPADCPRGHRSRARGGLRRGRCGDRQLEHVGAQTRNRYAVLPGATCWIFSGLASIRFHSAS
jgi:hypothetical protein